MSLSVTEINSDEIFALYGRVPLVLVRPDGFVAWRGTSPDDAEIARILDIVRGAARESSTTQITISDGKETHHAKIVC